MLLEQPKPLEHRMELSGAQQGIIGKLAGYLDRFLERHPRFTEQYVSALIKQETSIDDLYK